jgi:hypothetical protein
MTTTVTLTISDGTSINNVPYTANMTARNVLEAAYNLSVNPPTMPQINFWIDYYGFSLGYLVNMINGTTQMGDNYWFLYINGNVTTTGVDETIINPGDQVAFKYEAYNSSVHAQTVVGKIRSSAVRK